MIFKFAKKILLIRSSWSVWKWYKLCSLLSAWSLSPLSYPRRLGPIHLNTILRPQWWMSINKINRLSKKSENWYLIYLSSVTTFTEKTCLQKEHTTFRPDFRISLGDTYTLTAKKQPCLITLENIKMSRWCHRSWTMIICNLITVRKVKTKMLYNMDGPCNLYIFYKINLLNVWVGTC